MLDIKKFPEWKDHTWTESFFLWQNKVINYILQSWDVAVPKMSLWNCCNNMRSCLIFISIFDMILKILPYYLNFPCWLFSSSVILLSFLSTWLNLFCDHKYNKYIVILLLRCANTSYDTYHQWTMLASDGNFATKSFDYILIYIIVTCVKWSPKLFLNSAWFYVIDLDVKAIIWWRNHTANLSLDWLWYKWWSRMYCFNIMCSL